MHSLLRNCRGHFWINLRNKCSEDNHSDNTFIRTYIAIHVHTCIHKTRDVKSLQDGDGDVKGRLKNSNKENTKKEI